MGTGLEADRAGTGVGRKAGGASSSPLSSITMAASREPVAGAAASDPDAEWPFARFTDPAAFR